MLSKVNTCLASGTRQGVATHPSTSTSFGRLCMWYLRANFVKGILVLEYVITVHSLVINWSIHHFLTTGRKSNKIETGLDHLTFGIIKRDAIPNGSLIASIGWHTHRRKTFVVMTVLLIEFNRDLRDRLKKLISAIWWLLKENC